jgi:signal transduction histidine kinase
MSNPVAGLNGWFTRMAVGRHLSHRTVRARLTVLYGGLFVLSGAGLMAIAYLLLVNAGFVFSLQSGPAPATGPQGSPPPRSALRNVLPGAGALRKLPLPNAGMRTHPSAQTMVYWRGVARCMHQRGIAAFPDPAAAVPRSLGSVTEVSDRDGAILVYPTRLDRGSTAFTNAAIACGLFADNAQQLRRDTGTRAQVREQLLLQSAIALAAMSLLSLGLGWFIAGRALEPLEASYAAQRQFVASASHELRAPLTRQRALIQVALADPDANEASLRAAHERVLAAEQHLEEMISALLTLTRGQAGLERREQVDLAAVASEVLRAHGADANALGLRFHATLETAPAQGDPRLIERLLANVIGNAIRHNTPGGEVEITTGTRERAAFASVSNSGPVVGPEHVERLFRPFERLAGARTSHDGGHGLGLSIVRAIADAHRAELGVTAQPQGGLRVEVVFPVVRTGPRVPFAGARLRRTAPRTTLGD